MGDQAQFSDDISELWGPHDAGLLQPGPVRRMEPATATSGEQVAPSRNGIDDPLGALRQELRRLTFAVEASRYRTVDRADLEALRSELQDDLGQQMNHVLSELLAELNARLNHSESRAQERLDELAGRVVVAGATAGQRLDAAERDTARLAPRIDAVMGDVAALTQRLDHLAERVGGAATDRRVAEIESGLTQRLDHLAERVGATASDGRVAEMEFALTQRLDHLAEGVRAAASSERLEAAERETARLAELADAAGRDAARLGESMAALRAQLAGQIEAKAAVTDARFTQRLEALADRVDAAAPADRLEAAERESARLAELLDNLRGESVRPAELEASRADVYEAAVAAAARTQANLGARIDDLAGRLAGTDVAERLAELDQRLGGLGELLVAYRAQSVIGKDLDRAREQLEEALAAQIEALRAELAAAHDELAARVEANGSGTAALRTLWRRHQSSSRS